MQKLSNKIFFFILVISLMAPCVLLAANVSLVGSKNVFTVDEDFLVQVFLDTKNVQVNAVDGVVLLPRDLVTLIDIRDGNSVINFWIDRPHEDALGRVSFSGITTGGFSGNKKFLFGMVLRAKKIGIGSLAIEKIQVLQNDGLGTKVPTDNSTFSFSIVQKSAGSAVADLSVNDTDAPELFTPFVGNDTSLFDGKYFLSFSTTDKGSGVDHYEVREIFWGFGGTYKSVESPYLLQDQSLRSTIYVKAVDKSKNERIVELKASNSPFLLEYGPIFVIILLICIFLFKKKSRNIWLKFIR